MTAPTKTRELVINRSGRDIGARDRFISKLRADGISIIDAIKLVRGRFGLTLDEAKRLVSTHPAWKQVAAGSAPLQREFERVVTKSGMGRRQRPR